MTDLSEEINQVLSSQVEKTNKINLDLNKAECSFLLQEHFATIVLGGRSKFKEAEAKNKEGPKIITTAPQISPEDESKIRAELIKLFLLSSDSRLGIVDKAIKAIENINSVSLNDYEEKICKAVSLINTSAKHDPALYLSQFKEAMETLPENLRKELVPIIYEKPHFPTTYLHNTTRDLVLNPEGDVSNYYLRDIDFTLHPDLVDFKQAKMCGVDLTNSRLSELYLGGADLRGANLTNTDLGGANLDCADLSDSNLTNTNLRGASLIHARLGGISSVNNLSSLAVNLMNAELGADYFGGGGLPLIDSKTRFIPENLDTIGKAFSP